MIVSVRKKTLLAILVIALVCVGCSFGIADADVAQVMNGKSLRKVPVYGVDTQEKKVALTFDAAWGADKTQGILDILAQNEVKGTFFLVGFWIDAYPDMVKKIAESGCEIGNHSRNHLKMSALSRGDIDTEIDYVNDKVAELTGVKPKFFRAPFGDYDNELLDAVEQKGMIGIQWSVDSLDWKGLSATDILSRVSKGVKPGSIVLCHNNSDNILEALPLMIANLKNKGYSIVPMSELVYTENYTIDNNGIQHVKASDAA